MSELVRLDTGDEATAAGRISFDLTDFIGPDGPDFGDAAIVPYMAEAARGQVPVDFRVPNRTVTIPLQLMDANGLMFDEARAAVQAKAALFQRQGGWLERVVAGASWWADVVNATLKLGASTAAALGFVDADAVLTLECLPDFYGDEITLDPINGTGEIRATLKLGGVNATIAGDYPARARMVVSSPQTQRGLIWAVRSRHYDAAVTAALAYEAEAFTIPAPSTETALTGASGGQAVAIMSLTTDWQTLFFTSLPGLSGNPLTHVGSYRVWARCYTESSPPPRVRLRWTPGPSNNNPVENTAVILPDPAGASPAPFVLMDLGSVRVDASPVGPIMWWADIQAKGDAGGENIYIDKLWLQPVDDAAGTLSSSDLDVPVIHAGQQAQVRYDAMVTSDSIGFYYTRIARVLGDLFRLPPSGLEDQHVELLVKVSRGDLGQETDAAFANDDSDIDDLTAQVFYRPSWLIVPGADLIPGS